MNPSYIRRSAVSLITIMALAVQGSTASAGTKCYDFDGPEIGKLYVPGDQVDTQHSVINVQEFRPGGVPTSHPNPRAEIVNSDLPQAGAPSLKITSAVVQVLPKEPVQRITLSYAENTGANNTQKKVFGTNGERRNDLVGGFAQLNGIEMGRPQMGGRALISVTATPDDPNNLPTWVRGEITVESLDKSLSAIAMGVDVQGLIDHFCLHQ